MTFYERLNTAWNTNNSLLCVGLDADQEVIADYISGKNKVFEFNKQIIDATHSYVCAYKPQISYYNAYGIEDQLQMSIEYIKTNYPDILVILDAKRGDIGKTSELYAKEAFLRYKANAVTINPYMGSDSVLPFTSYQNHGCIVLCKTSNPSSSEIQNISDSSNEKIYQKVLNLAKNKWNTNKNIMLVTGATYPQELKEIRQSIGDIPLLVPGIGAQGGSIQEVVQNGQTKNSKGLLISSSRAIIYASKDKNFAKNAAKVAQQTKEEINKYRS